MISANAYQNALRHECQSCGAIIDLKEVCVSIKLDFSISMFLLCLSCTESMLDQLGRQGVTYP